MSESKEVQNLKAQMQQMINNAKATNAALEATRHSLTEAVQGAVNLKTQIIMSQQQTNDLNVEIKSLKDQLKAAEDKLAAQAQSPVIPPSLEPEQPVPAI